MYALTAGLLSPPADLTVPALVQAQQPPGGLWGQLGGGPQLGANPLQGASAQQLGADLAAQFGPGGAELAAQLGSAGGSSVDDAAYLYQLLQSATQLTSAPRNQPPASQPPGPGPY